MILSVKKIINVNVVKESLALLEIDELGLSGSDRKLLEVLISKFNGGPVGLTTLAAATGEEEETIEDVVEPYLLQLGLIERTPRGRIATTRSYTHLGFDIPQQK